MACRSPEGSSVNEAGRSSRWVAVAFCLAMAIWGRAAAATDLSGSLTDSQGKIVFGATITILRAADSSRRTTITDQSGRFSFASLNEGEYRLTAEFSGFAILTRTIVVAHSELKPVDLQFSGIATQNQSVTVTANVSDAGVFVPDPAQRVMIREETLDANPGRPGMPISIPGMPVESPAGGVKPPQYFVPGVAGDHGEPIAMFFQVGGYLFQNNLPANAHETATPTRTWSSPSRLTMCRPMAAPSMCGRETTRKTPPWFSGCATASNP